MPAKLPLSEAKVEARKAFRRAKGMVAKGIFKPRTVSEGLIGVYWDLIGQLSRADQQAFRAWFEAEHEKAGREVVGK
jgi:hypothetical protein